MATPSGPLPDRPAARGATSGVRIAGTGSALASKRVTNADLERIMDTSDEWIVQRTGIRERRMHDEAMGENTGQLATAACREALKDAGMTPTDLEHIVVATMTPDMPTPCVACNVADRLGAGTIGAMDINGACSGFVFSLNAAHELIRGGLYRTIAVIGADCITRHCDFTTYGRAVSVLFGDAAAAFILTATPDRSKGLLAQAMHTDGGGAKHLYIPMRDRDFPVSAADHDTRRLGCIQMNGQAVFKFAVTTFPKLIEQTLEKAGVRADDVDHYVCHQSNFRILESARERFGLAPEKLHVNIDRYGNTVAASVPLILDELKKAGRVKEGQKIMFLAFGAGLTWGSSLWQC